MPLQWKIDHQAQRVEAIADGKLSAADVRNYLKQITEAGALPYAKLFDASEARVFLSVDRTKGDRLINPAICNEWTRPDRPTGDRCPFRQPS